MQVRVYSRTASSYNRLAHLADRIELVGGDIRASKALANAVEGCDYVYHLIGTTVPATSNRDPMFDTETNLVPALRLLEVCVQAEGAADHASFIGGTVYGDTGSELILEMHVMEPRSSYWHNEGDHREILWRYFIDCTAHYPDPVASRMPTGLRQCSRRGDAKRGGRISGQNGTRRSDRAMGRRFGDARLCTWEMWREPERRSGRSPLSRYSMSVRELGLRSGS